MKKNKIVKAFTAFIMLSLFCSIGTYAQEQRVTMKVKNASLKDVFKKIEKQTTYRFSYRDVVVDNRKDVTMSKVNVSVSSVLDEALKGRNLIYKIVSPKLIAISVEKKDVAPSSSPKKLRVIGVVRDDKGEPIIGASVKLKGNTVGTITDSNGQFSIDVYNDAVLDISYVGYKGKEVSVGNKQRINVTLKEDTKLLDDVVVVGYGTQRKGNLTGSVSEVKSDKLTVAPLATVSNALAGVLPGLVARQNSGMPGGDGASLSIRGFDSPLVIVDGVESSFDNIDASQIESISILKDGASSIYGSRAGNGVVLVTTKRGVSQKPTITVNSSYTLQGITNWVRPANSYERAVMEREAFLQSGGQEDAAPWTEEQIEHFRTGDDPVNYGNTDWFKAAFRKYAPEQNHNISVRGGSDKIKYMGFFGYNDQETMVRKSGGGYKRYNLQSNMDAKITEDLKMSIDFSTAFEDKDYAVRGLYNGANTWQDLYASNPRYPSSLPDPTKLAWAGIDVGSIVATTNMDISGYNKNRNVDMKAAGSLTYDFHKLVPGLQFKAFINYAYSNNYAKGFQKPVNYYLYNAETDTYTLAGTYNATASLNEGMGRSATLTQQYSLNYDYTFFKDHHVTALALYELIDYHGNGFGAGRVNFLTPLIEQMFAGSTVGMSTSGWASEMGRASYVGRLNYDYKGRYLLETIFRADASAKFQKGHRWGYFPSVSVGWNISEEPWMQKLNFVDNIKLRASYGQSGNDGVGNFQYLTGYAMSGRPYLFNGVASTGLTSTGMANPYLTWEKMKMYNAGLDFSLWKHQLYGTFEVFYRLRDGIPGQRSTSLPSTFGATLPVENLNSIDNRGFELMLGTTGSWRGLKYDINGNLSWSRAKWHYYDEPTYDDPDQERLYKLTGHWTDRSFGFKSAGLFTSQEEIDALDYEYKDLGGNSTLRPGDVKYVDVNGDHVLDWKDQQEIGKGNVPHWMFGLSFKLQYKGFDATGLFQGAFGYSTYINGLSDMTTLRFKNRWTEETNNPNAIIPRLGGAGSDSWGSDYWLKNTSYLRLKNMSIGYTLPSQLLNKVGIQKVRIYIAGTNLFTLSTISKYGIDPEVLSGNITRYYPQQQTFSFGVNLSM
jgi:TonB-linked SusC/RagA family outer membrane protein